MTGIENIAQSELFGGMADAALKEIAAIGVTRHFAAGKPVFSRGDPADELYVVRLGRAELTFPLVVMGETKETRFQSLEPGRTLAWSALVPPHRLTMSARATTDLDLVAFERGPLLKLLSEYPVLGYSVMSRLSKVIAARMHEMAELWAREVQRSVAQVYR